MPRRTAVLSILVLSLALLAAKAIPHRFVDRWTTPDLERVKFKKILVVAITDDVAARKVFEDRFVSHLRGREEVDGVTSRSIVPDLQAIADPQEILQKIEELEIDGVISVRLVSLKQLEEDAWGAEWRSQVDSRQTLRQLIDESLPVVVDKSKKFGLEAALWEVKNGKRIWAARTDTYKRKELKDQAANFTQMVMNGLTGEDLL